MKIHHSIGYKHALATFTSFRIMLYLDFVTFLCIAWLNHGYHPRCNNKHHNEPPAMPNEPTAKYIKDTVQYMIHFFDLKPEYKF